MDPLQFEMSIQAEDLAGYVPSFGWEMGPPSDKQIQTLEKLGHIPRSDRLCWKSWEVIRSAECQTDRRTYHTEADQVSLESKGFQHVGTWEFEHAKHLIDRIAGNGWRVPQGINLPAEYKGA